MSDLVGNPNCWFSHAQAHLSFFFLVINIKMTEGGSLHLLISFVVFLFSVGMIYDNDKRLFHNLRGVRRKQDLFICKNKGADQLCSSCKAALRLCFRYMDSTIPLISKYKISSLQPSSVLVQLCLCWTCSKTTLLFFS